MFDIQAAKLIVPGDVVYSRGGEFGLVTDSGMDPQVGWEITIAVIDNTEDRDEWKTDSWYCDPDSNLIVKADRNPVISVATPFIVSPATLIKTGAIIRWRSDQGPDDWAIVIDAKKINNTVYILTTLGKIMFDQFQKVETLLQQNTIRYVSIKPSQLRPGMMMLNHLRGAIKITNVEQGDNGDVSVWCNWGPFEMKMSPYHDVMIIVGDEK